MGDADDSEHDNPAEPVDLVVVGAGLAGLTAACAAAWDWSLSVHLIEATSTIPGDGNTSVSGGTFHANYLDPLLPPGVLVESMVAATDGDALRNRLTGWADAIAPSIDWAQEHGANLVTHPESGVLQAKPARRGGRLISQGQGIHRFASVLADQAQGAGARLSTHARAVELLSDNDRVTGVVATDPHGGRTAIRARNVLLADGGFQANPQLVERHVRSSNYLLRAVPSGRGDGLLIAQAFGAAVTGMDRFYGHCLHSDAAHNADLWPFPVLDILAEHGQVMTRDGVDISLGRRDGVDIANAVAASGADCWTIANAATWHAAQFGRGVLLRDYLRGQTAQAFTGPTAEAALARGRCRAPDTSAYAEGFEGYVALPTIAGITLTMGGVATTGDAQVLHVNGQPIVGLLAAGSTTGGLHGGPHAGYAGGLLEALSGGLAAARTAARPRP